MPKTGVLVAVAVAAAVLLADPAEASPWATLMRNVAGKGRGAVARKTASAADAPSSKVAGYFKREAMLTGQDAATVARKALEQSDAQAYEAVTAAYRKLSPEQASLLPRLRKADAYSTAAQALIKHLEDTSGLEKLTRVPSEVDALTHALLLKSKQVRAAREVGLAGDLPVHFTDSKLLTAVVDFRKRCKGRCWKATSKGDTYLPAATSAETNAAVQALRKGQPAPGEAVRRTAVEALEHTGPAAPYQQVVRQLAEANPHMADAVRRATDLKRLVHGVRGQGTGTIDKLGDEALELLSAVDRKPAASRSTLEKLVTERLAENSSARQQLSAFRAGQNAQ